MKKAGRETGWKKKECVLKTEYMNYMSWNTTPVVEPTHLKNIEKYESKREIFPKVRGENKKTFESTT